MYFKNTLIEQKDRAIGQVMDIFYNILEKNGLAAQALQQVSQVPAADVQACQVFKEDYQISDGEDNDTFVKPD